MIWEHNQSLDVNNNKLSWRLQAFGLPLAVRRTRTPLSPFLKKARPTQRNEFGQIGRRNGPGGRKKGAKIHAMRPARNHSVLFARRPRAREFHASERKFYSSESDFYSSESEFYSSESEFLKLNIFTCISVTSERIWTIQKAKDDKF